MMDTVMGRSVNDPFKRPKIVDHLSVYPKLIQKVELSVNEKLAWRYEKRHW